mgnify:CR=1 FL=1
MLILYKSDDKENFEQFLLDMEFIKNLVKKPVKKIGVPYHILEKGGLSKEVLEKIARQENDYDVTNSYKLGFNQKHSLIVRNF